MNEQELVLLADVIVDVVRANHEKEVPALEARILEVVRKAIAELPAGPAGPQGPPGERGDVGPMGPQGDKGESVKGDKGDPGESIIGPVGPKGLDGRDGIDGKDGEPGRPGIDGKDGGPGPIGEKGLDGKDGRDGRDGLAGANGRDGKDGEPGRDALQIEILSTIDETKSFPRGTFATYKGGLIRALRNTDPITAGLAAAGWDVIVNGIASIDYPDAEDPQIYSEVRTLTDGTKSALTTRKPIMVYRGVYRAGEEYWKGHVVTFGGSTWHCMVAETKASPGSGGADWKLIAKEGRPGKDASPAPPAPAPTMDAIVDAVVKRLSGKKS